MGTRVQDHTHSASACPALVQERTALIADVLDHQDQLAYTERDRERLSRAYETLAERHKVRIGELTACVQESAPESFEWLDAHRELADESVAFHRRSKQAWAVRNCGKGAVLFETDCGCGLAAPGRCFRIGCPQCMRDRAHERVQRITPLLQSYARLRFLTLSARNCERGDLKDAMHALVTAFGKLRRTKWWARCFPRGGGIYALEVTLGRGGTWNQHLHVLVGSEDGDYPKHADLVAQWKRSLGVDYAPHAWIGAAHAEAAAFSEDRLKRTAAAAREACKYITKGMGTLPTWAACELIEAKEGTRWFSAFGACYGMKTTPEPGTGCQCEHGQTFQWVDWVAEPNWIELADAGYRVVGLLRTRKRRKKPPPLTADLGRN